MLADKEEKRRNYFNRNLSKAGRRKILEISEVNTRFCCCCCGLRPIKSFWSRLSRGGRSSGRKKEREKGNIKNDSWTRRPEEGDMQQVGGAA